MLPICYLLSHSHCYPVSWLKSSSQLLLIDFVSILKAIFVASVGYANTFKRKFALSATLRPWVRRVRNQCLFNRSNSSKRHNLWAPLQTLPLHQRKVFHADRPTPAIDWVIVNAKMTRRVKWRRSLIVTQPWQSHVVHRPRRTRTYKTTDPRRARR